MTDSQPSEEFPVDFEDEDELSSVPMPVSVVLMIALLLTPPLCLAPLIFFAGQYAGPLVFFLSGWIAICTTLAGGLAFRFRLAEHLIAMYAILLLCLGITLVHVLIGFPIAIYAGVLLHLLSHSEKANWCRR